MNKVFILLAAALAFSGCSVFSRNITREADRSVTMDMVQAHPDEYKGKRVIWGGMIESTEPQEKTTEIEIIETELGADDTPQGGTSRGRFLVESDKFLDPKIYQAGKEITVAGVVQGVTTRKIGKMDYPFPVVKPLDIKTFEPRAKQGYGYQEFPQPYYPMVPSPYPYPYPYPSPYPGPYPYRYPYPYPYNYPY